MMRFYEFDTFFVRIDNDKIVCEEFNEYPDYYGIIMTVNNIKYELIHNLKMGYRLIISDDNGMSKDLPFKKETEHFLPDEVHIGRMILFQKEKL